MRRRGHDAEEARDLTQGFFLHLLEHKALRQVDPVKGKFRSFLAVSLQNYLSDQADRACKESCNRVKCRFSAHYRGYGRDAAINPHKR